MKLGLTILFYFSVWMYLFAQNFEWAKSYGGAGTEYNLPILSADNSKLYVFGTFEGTVDFDPGPGVFNITSNGNSDFFIQKLDTSGNFIWAKSIGGTGHERAFAAKLDANDNLYLAGEFSAVVDFDPSFVGTTNLTAVGTNDIFTLKLDSAANFIWVKQIEALTYENISGILIDDREDVYTVGTFKNTVDFDPGPGVFNLTSNGRFDFFIQKLNANGNFIWAKSIGGVDDDEPESVDLDADGNIYVTGKFASQVDFDPGLGTYNLTGSYADCFIQKLDSSGNFLWAKQLKGGTGTYGINPYDIKVGALNAIYLTGQFGSGDFDPDTTSTFNLYTNGDRDAFIQKLDANGNFIWVKQMGGTGFDAGSSIATDINNNIYLAGFFESQVDFDPGLGVFNLTSNGNSDIFIQKLDINGDLIWGKGIGGTGHDGGNVIIDIDGNIYMGGAFYNTVDFAPDTTTYQLSSNGSSDAFVLKLSQFCNNTSTRIDTQIACNSYIWIDGITYTSSNNTATDTLTTTNGCDSIIQLDLTILASAIGVDTQIACNSYTWINGITYTLNNNTAMDTIIGGATNGCDSMVTLNLTILGTNPLPYQEDFTGTFPPLNTSIINPDNSTTWIGGVWTATNGSTNDVMYLDYSAYNAAGQKDYLVLPLLDLDTVTIAELSFDVSYNPYSASYSDTLAVEISTDCGLTYQPIYTKGGLDLSIDNSYVTSVWIPNNTSDWRKERIDLNSYVGNDVLLRFVGINGSGNNLYLDNINIGLPIMTNTVEISNAETIKVYPTPTKDYLILELLENSQDIQLEIVDVNGRVILSQQYQAQAQIEVSVEHLITGIYFVKIESSRDLQVVKMLKE